MLTESLLQRKLQIINIGLEGFYDSLVSQGIDVVQVEWKPPAQGDQDIMDILEKLL